MKPGDRVKVFDPVIWGGRDKGNNEHCWKEATVLDISEEYGEPTITVQFDHDGRTSRGHFLHSVRS